jgi:hypothetical protein
MAIIDVTTGQGFATVSDAILGSNAGDVIQLSAGTYSEDFPKITHDLTIQGVGGLAKLTPLPTVNPQPGDPAYQMPANGQGILVTAAGVKLDHLELTGAAVPANNGAGVRYETGSLIITNSWLHDNQNGLLANANAGADIWIDKSEFDHNGAGDGFSHNLYVGQIGTLSVTNSYFHGANQGHEIKSRAATTIITNTRIQDEPGAPTSFSVDLPDGGIALISNSVIEKGQDAPNFFLVHFGGENPVAADASLTIAGVTVINDFQPPTLDQSFIFNQADLPGGGGLALPSITDSTFYGFTAPQLMGAPFPVPGTDFGPTNTFLPIAAAPGLDTSHPWEVPAPGAGPLLAAALAAVLLLRRFRSGDPQAGKAGRVFDF